MIQRHIVLGLVPGTDWDVGQVTGIDRGVDKLLALKLVKQLPHGMLLPRCHCGAEFITERAMRDHQDRRHLAATPEVTPEPPRKAKKPPGREHPPDTHPAPPEPQPNAEEAP